jgi:transcriptional regulator with XRE-family HTH domain
MTIPTITLGMRLGMARKSARISADDLAARLGVTPRTISRYENDATPVPMSILYAYQAECDVPMAWLRGEVALTQETVSCRWLSESPPCEAYAA